MVYLSASKLQLSKLPVKTRVSLLRDVALEELIGPTFFSFPNVLVATLIFLGLKDTPFRLKYTNSVLSRRGEKLGGW